MNAERIKIQKPRQNRTILKKAVVALLILLLSYITVSMGVSAMVFRILFQRTESDPAAELRYTDVDPQKYPRQAMRFASGGNSLQGYLYGAADARGVIVVANGIHAPADTHLPEILYFADNGWRVFTYDGTGVGDSEGDGIRGLSQSKIDLENAIAFLRSNGATKDLPIVLYGHSAGGYAAAAVLREVDGLCAAVCIAGFDLPCEIMLYHARQRVGALADIEYPFMRLQNFFLFGKDADLSAWESISGSDIPVMIVEADGDTVVPQALGIGRYRERIQNPNAVFLTVDEPYRNTHAAMWLSAEAAAYRAQERDAKTADKAKGSALDPDFMDALLSFYASALQR